MKCIHLAVCERVSEGRSDADTPSHRGYFSAGFRDTNFRKILNARPGYGVGQGNHDKRCLRDIKISGIMDTSQESDVSMKDEDYKSSDTEGPTYTTDPQVGEKETSPQTEGETVKVDANVNVTAATSGSTSNGSDLLESARREFNKNRKIIIKNIPPVRYEVSCE